MLGPLKTFRAEEVNLKKNHLVHWFWSHQNKRIVLQKQFFLVDDAIVDSLDKNLFLVSIFLQDKTVYSQREPILIIDYFALLLG